MFAYWFKSTSWLYIKDEPKCEVFYWMLLGMHKYVYLIQSIDMGVARHTWTPKKYSQY